MRRIAILAVALLAACAVPGCGPDRSEVRLSLYWNAVEDPAPEVVVRLRDGLVVEEFLLDESHSSVGPLKTGSAGTLRVEFVLLSDGIPSATAGSIDLPLKKDWRWGVDIWIAEEDPMLVCFGCFGSELFWLDPQLGYREGLKLYVVWGGNSISNPVVY